MAKVFPTLNNSEVLSAVQNPGAFVTRFCLSPFRGKDAPLPDYDYFKPLWDAWAKGEDILVRKTRQMTVSWMVCGLLLWDVWTPLHRDWAAMVMSRAQDLVDDGGDHSTADSLLGRCRYMYERLPEMIRFPIEFTYNRVVNQKTGSFIRGKSSTSQAGRGGSYVRAVQDEDAFIPHSEDVYSAIRPGVPSGLCKVSTPNGKDNNYYRMQSIDNTPFTVMDMHWRQHPLRACPATCKNPGSDNYEDHTPDCWYWRACQELGFNRLRIARELNISFEESAGGRVFYNFGPQFIGTVPRLDGETVWRGWDFGAGGTTAIWFANVVPIHTATGRLRKQLRIFDFYEAQGMGAKHYREVCYQKAKEYGGFKVVDIGDPYTLNARESVGSWRENLCDGSHPYKIWCEPSGCIGVAMETVIDSARNFMQYVEAQDGQHVPLMKIDNSLRTGIGHLEQWCYPTDTEGRIVGTKPAHDEHSHAGTALYYMTHYIEPAAGAVPDLDLRAVAFSGDEQMQPAF